jgi:hypothetical protein
MGQAESAARGASMTDDEIRATALAPGWPLGLDPDSFDGRRLFVARFNVRNSCAKLSLKDGLDGISIAPVDAGAQRLH